VVNPAFGQLAISKVLVNPIGDESNHDLPWAYEFDPKSMANFHPEAIQIVNLGNQSQTIEGWKLTLSSSSGEITELDLSNRQIPPYNAIRPLSTLMIHWNPPPILWKQLYGYSVMLVLDNEVGNSHLDNVGGSLMLSSPEKVEHFVQWGTRTPLEEVAVASDKWVFGEFVPTPNEGEWLEYDLGGIGARDWVAGDGSQFGFEYTAVAPLTWGTVKNQYRMSGSAE
jgi:hypothetical protein